MCVGEGCGCVWGKGAKQLIISILWEKFIAYPVGGFILVVMHCSLAQVRLVNVTNPSYQPLLIQPVLLQHYTKFQLVVDLLSDQLNPDLHSLNFSPSMTSSFGFQHDHSSVNDVSSLDYTVVNPNDNLQISVTFSPSADIESNTLLLIRNNLTVFDHVLLKGRGAVGVFSISGIQPGSESLLFEFTHAMMEKCRGMSHAKCVNMHVHCN